MTREETYRMLDEYVDYLLQKSDAEHPFWNIEKIVSGKPNKWNYIDGCMITALLSTPISIQRTPSYSGR